MKYWLLTTEFPPFHGGGISTYCEHTVNMLVQKNIDVTVFVSDDFLEKERVVEKRQNLKIIRFKPGENKAYYNYLGYTAALSFQFSEEVELELTKSEKPDFIEAQDYNGIAYYLTYKKKLGNEKLQETPIVITCHAPSFYILDKDHFPTYKLPDYWTGEMEKWSIAAADICISPSHYQANNINDHFFTSKKIPFQIVPNPYKVEDIIDQAPISVQKGDIVFFGKMVFIKGILQLLEHVKPLWDTNHSFTISIIGDDHYFAPKQKNIKDIIIEKYPQYIESGRIKFEGKLPKDQIKQRLQKAHAIVIPSLVDNLPYTLLESMGMGKIVLCSRSGGQIEVIDDGKNGFLFELQNQKEFEEKFLRILNLEENQIETISYQAKQKIEFCFSYNKIYSEKTELLNQQRAESKRSRIFPFVHKTDFRIREPLNKPFEKGKLSIVIPYYNSGKYLMDTVNSLDRIEYDNYEVIIVNDGSTDDLSLNVLYQLVPKLKYNIITQPNKGLAEARNTGARKACGEFLAFLDADDTVEPDYYRKAIKTLKAYDNISFVGCWTHFFEGSSAIWPTFTPEPPYVLLHNTMNTSALVYKRNDFLRGGLNDAKMVYGMEDYDSMLSMIEAGLRGVVIPEILFNYRIRPDSMSKGFNKVNQLYLYRILSKNHKELYSYYGTEIFNFLNANGPSYLYDNPTWEPNTDVLEMRKRILTLEDEKRELEYFKKNFQTDPHNSNNTVIDIRYDSLNDANKSEMFHKNQYDELRNWYHEQYDVLPLWFKRAGHIVKVIQGKRSLKSLIKNK